MNTRLIKSTFLVMLLSLISNFSSFAMEPEHVEPAPAPEVPEQFFGRAYLGYNEILLIRNHTIIPIFLSIGGITVQLNPGESSSLNITDAWINNPDITSDRPRMFAAMLSAAAGGEPFGTIQFLMNANATNVETVLNIGTYDQIAHFNIEGIRDLMFIIILQEDPTKAAGNFENTDFILYEAVQMGATLKMKEIFSEELRKKRREHFKERLQKEVVPKIEARQLELEKIELEELERQKRELERKRLLERPEAKPEKIFELPLMKRK